MTDQASLKALHRYEDDLLRLKSLVEAEKEVFINEIKYAQAQDREKTNERQRNLKMNQDFLNRQREAVRKAREDARKEGRLYYKPHFGPEETQEKLQSLKDDKLNKTSSQFNWLRSQVQERDEDMRRRKEAETAMDC